MDTNKLKEESKAELSVALSACIRLMAAVDEARSQILLRGSSGLRFIKHEEIRHHISDVEEFLGNVKELEHQLSTASQPT